MTLAAKFRTIDPGEYSDPKEYLKAVEAIDPGMVASLENKNVVFRFSDGSFDVLGKPKFEVVK